MRRLSVIFTVLLGVSVLAEFLVHTHARFGVDGSYGFHAWFGGVACAAIIAVSKLLGIFLKRKDTYYDS
ncbi:MAG: hypothetical protein WBO06_13915 [Gammaproteobacteria bacterium]